MALFYKLDFLSHLFYYSFVIMLFIWTSVAATLQPAAVTVIGKSHYMVQICNCWRQAVGLIAKYTWDTHENY